MITGKLRLTPLTATKLAKCAEHADSSAQSSASGPAISTSSVLRRTWMQSPGHSLAASITSRRRWAGTSARVPGASMHLAGGIFNVREAVDVEFEDLGRILHAEPVAGAQILVDPDPQRVGRHRVAISRLRPPGTCPSHPYPRLLPESPSLPADLARITGSDHHPGTPLSRIPDGTRRYRGRGWHPMPSKYRTEPVCQACTKVSGIQQANRPTRLLTPDNVARDGVPDGRGSAVAAIVRAAFSSRARIARAVKVSE